VQVELEESAEEEAETLRPEDGITIVIGTDRGDSCFSLFRRLQELLSNLPGKAGRGGSCLAEGSE
jgi:hypothetical protein